MYDAFTVIGLELLNYKKNARRIIATIIKSFKLIYVHTIGLKFNFGEKILFTYS